MTEAGMEVSADSGEAGPAFQPMPGQCSGACRASGWDADKGIVIESGARLNGRGWASLQ